MAYKASAGQIKAIWALGRRLGMDADDLRGIAYRISGVESIKSLTSREAGRMIEELKLRAGEPAEMTAGGAASKATMQQRRMIDMLVRQMGWADQPERLRGYLRRMCDADDVRFLSPQQASKVINGLKAMQAGGRSERRREA